MNNEPNRERELTEKELKGIAGGASGPYESPEEMLFSKQQLSEEKRKARVCSYGVVTPGPTGSSCG